MRLHYKKAYNGDENSLPKRDDIPNATMFKEASDLKAFAKKVNFLSLISIFILAIPFFILGNSFFKTNFYQIAIVFILMYPSIFIHEFLHALCFKEDVYLYTAFKDGVAFVVGNESMSKLQFIIMSLCPNFFLGFIPYLIFLFNNQLIGFGLYGIFMISAGFGDYINVFNAITQMPKGSKTFISGFHSYWYLEKEEK